MLHCDSPTVGWWPTENKQAELVGKGGELSAGVGGRAYHVDNNRGGVGKSAHPIMCQGKGRFDTVGGCSPLVL